MTANDKETDSSASATCSNMFSPHVACSGDCSPFQNWKGEQPKTVGEQAVVFQSLVVTLKWQPALDVRMEAKMVRFLGFVTPKSSRLAANFLGSLASHSDDSSTTFIQCIVVLISSASKRIITTTMKMFDSLIIHCSIANRLALVTAAEAVDIHVYLLNIIWNSLGLATRNSLTRLGIEEDDEQQAVYETVLKYVLVPSEKYIWHLCANRFSIIDGDQSRDFLEILAHLLRISPSYQPTMDFSCSMITTHSFSFAAALALLVSGRQCVDRCVCDSGWNCEVGKQC
ncbi:hypothetical protein BLNAU_14937 [Blattamonas nauphoetae]|uniref:Uncharacterized protein n=1 Tax=Blattamonas nauphoetae TaxID=2049346 RepID=A0ABQ9XFF0_9EUKA|nr:hypothetical protein BLNAU_14937 [Blattamonas nauphoetae]